MQKNWYVLAYPVKLPTSTSKGIWVRWYCCPGTLSLQEKDHNCCKVLRKAIWAETSSYVSSEGISACKHASNEYAYGSTLKSIASISIF